MSIQHWFTYRQRYNFGVVNAPAPVFFDLFDDDFLFFLGGSQIIKDAISKPGDPQIQEDAWEKMLPLIKNLLDLKQSYSALNQVT